MKAGFQFRHFDVWIEDISSEQIRVHFGGKPFLGDPGPEAEDSIAPDKDDTGIWNKRDGWQVSGRNETRAETNR